MMKIVIDIPKEIYTGEKTRGLLPTVIDAISNGTPLPEGHGRLIDEKELIEEIECEEIDGSYYDVIYAHSIYDAPTIIEGSESE